GEALNENRAYLIGRGLAAEVFEDTGPIAVSRDMRSHSPALASALMRGLCEGGCNVLEIGLAATPMNYWANAEYSCAGCVQVTASHNGPAYNGFKVSGPRAAPIDFFNGLDRVEQFVLAVEAGKKKPVASTLGAITKVENALEKYLSFMDGFLSKEGN